MKFIVLAAAVILAHDWYPFGCCGEEHCHPVACSSLTKDDQGNYHWGMWSFGGIKAAPSPDGQCHVCIRPDHTPLCLFMPADLS